MCDSGQNIGTLSAEGCQQVMAAGRLFDLITSAVGHNLFPCLELSGASAGSNNTDLPLVDTGSNDTTLAAQQLPTNTQYNTTGIEAADSSSSSGISGADLSSLPNTNDTSTMDTLDSGGNTTDSNTGSGMSSSSCSGPNCHTSDSHGNSMTSTSTSGGGVANAQADRRRRKRVSGEETQDLESRMLHEDSNYSDEIMVG